MVVFYINFNKTKELRQAVYKQYTRDETHYVKGVSLNSGNAK